jgi:hypothetical protein
MNITPKIDYKRVRKRGYPPIEEQLDAIIKALKHIRDSGLDIGSDGTQLVEHVAKVKRQTPKPKGGNNGD